MNLARTYAALIHEVDPNKVFAYMKRRGHVSLLPQVLRIVEREPVPSDVVTVAHERDIAKHKKSHPNARFVVDPRVVGGYSARTGSEYIDRTYRRALVTLYQKITAP